MRSVYEIRLWGNSESLLLYGTLDVVGREVPSVFAMEKIFTEKGGSIEV